MNEEEKMKEFERLLDASSVRRGRPPTPLGMDRFKGELEDLMAMEDLSPARFRRIAELTEIVHGNEAAWPWWQKAAKDGDPEAIAYLLELIEEAEGPE